MTERVKCELCPAPATVMVAVGMRKRPELPMCDRCRAAVGQRVTRRLR